MRHGIRNKKFDRHSAHRNALLKNLARDLLINERITTTLAKAKEARRLAEKLITLGKKDSLKNRRLTFEYLQDRTLVRRLFVDLAPLFKERAGGYTRIIRAYNRSGDGAPMAILELTARTEVPKSKEVKAKEQKEEKKPALAKPETQVQEKPKHQVKPAEKKAPQKQTREPKKGITSGLRKYFGGDKKGQ